MNEPDSKKLIAGFLVLATITSSAAFALSGYLTTRANKNEGSPASIFKAFSDNKPEDLNKSLDYGKNNLTDELSDLIAEKLILANQSGPIVDGNDAYINIPANLDSIINSLLDDASKNISLPSFEADASKILLQKNHSERDVQKYLDALNSALGPLSGSEIKNLESKLSTSTEVADVSVVGAGEILFKEVEDALYKIQVPEPFISLHKSALRIVIIQRILFSSAVSPDPLRALAIHQRAKSSLEEAGVKLISDIQLLSLTWPTILKSSRKNFVNVAQASAFDAAAAAIIESFCRGYAALPGGITPGAVPTSDFSTRVATCTAKGLQYLDYLEKILVSALKKSLVQTMITSVVKWANGNGGDPTYVTNWASYLSQAAETGAFGFLQAASGKLCSNYRNELVEKIAKSTGARSPFNANRMVGELGFEVGCPLESMVSDIDNFYGDFSDGGWDAFLQLGMPSSNYYGSSFITELQTQSAAEEIRRSAELKALAGQGFVGKERCEDGRAPVNGACEDKSEPRVTAPGKLVSDIVSRGITASVDQLIHANKLEDILVQYMSSALTKLITSSGNKGITDSSLSSQNSVDAEAVCNAYQDAAERQRCLDELTSIAGGPGASTPRESLLTQARTILETTSSTLEYVQISLGVIANTIEILNTVALSCPNETDRVTSELEIIALDQAMLSAKAEELISRKYNLEVFISDVEAHDPEDTPFFTQKQNELRNDYGIDGGGMELGEESGRVSYFQNKLREATNLLNQCSVE